MIYRYTQDNVIQEVLNESEVPLGVSFEIIEYDDTPVYDPYLAQTKSMELGKSVADAMLLELGARAKMYRQQTGIAVGSSLIEVNLKLENFLLKGDLVNAVDEVETIVASGQVDNFVDVYADALIRIEEFLNA